MKKFILCGIISYIFCFCINLSLKIIHILLLFSIKNLHPLAHHFTPLSRTISFTVFLFVSNNLSASRDLSSFRSNESITINPLTDECRVLKKSKKKEEEERRRTRRGRKRRGERQGSHVHRVANREKKLRYEKAHPPYDNSSCTG